MGEYRISDLNKVVVLPRNLDGTYSEPSPGAGSGSDVNVTNAQIPVTLTDAGGDAVSITPAGYLEVRIAETAAGGGGLTDAELRATPVPVSGTFWPGTQPVSGTVAISNQVTQPLTDSQLRATPVPVSGTFWQGTQPVSGPLTDAQLRATAVDVAVTNSVAVTGTFWQATQPVSGPLTDAQLRATAVPVSLSEPISIDDNGGSITVDGTFWQATQPVSGTFWQATQPVSGPLTDAQLRATAVPVSGTVTVQDGGGSVTVDGPLTDSQLRATAVPVRGDGKTATGVIDANGEIVELILDGGYSGCRIELQGTYTSSAIRVESTQDGTNWRDHIIRAGDDSGTGVSITNATALPVYLNVAGCVKVRCRATTWTGGDTVTVTIMASPGAAQDPLFRAAVQASDPNAFNSGLVVKPFFSTLTKGTQGTRGVDVQRLRDAGRVHFSIKGLLVAPGAVGTEALLSMTRSNDGGAESAGATTFAITSTKRMVINRVRFSALQGATAPATPSHFALVWNTAAVAASSPRLWWAQVDPLANRLWTETHEFGEGLDITGNIQIGVAYRFTTTNPTNVSAIIQGYEY